MEINGHVSPGTPPEPCLVHLKRFPGIHSKHKLVILQKNCGAKPVETILFLWLNNSPNIFIDMIVASSLL